MEKNLEPMVEKLLCLKICFMNMMYINVDPQGHILIPDNMIITGDTQVETSRWRPQGWQGLRQGPEHH